jgi:hypothetical protein
MASESTEAVDSRSVSEGINYDPNLGYSYLAVQRTEGTIVERGPVTTMYDYAAEYAIERLTLLNRVGQAKGTAFFIMEIRPGEQMRVVGKAYRSRRGNIVTKELAVF